MLRIRLEEQHKMNGGKAKETRAPRSFSILQRLTASAPLPRSVTALGKVGVCRRMLRTNLNAVSLQTKHSIIAHCCQRSITSVHSNPQTVATKNAGRIQLKRLFTVWLQGKRSYFHGTSNLSVRFIFEN